MSAMHTQIRMKVPTLNTQDFQDKIMNSFLILLLGFSLLSQCSNTQQKPCVSEQQYTQYPYDEISPDEKYVIGAWHAGFFSSFFVTLTHLAWCDRNNKIPVVFWDKRSLYYQPDGYNGATNVWEYYFEPVSHLRYTPGDVMHRQYFAADNTCFVAWHFNEDFRHDAYKIIQKYIKIKPNIQHKIESFYKEKMQGKKIIGLHIRGTDKWIDTTPVPLEKIINYANNLADENTKFLLATEDIHIFENAKTMLKGQIIYYDVHRSSSTQGGWWTYLPNKAELGEEVLIESQLLARCDVLLHTNMSNVSIAVLCFNPTMNHKVFIANERG